MKKTIPYFFLLPGIVLLLFFLFLPLLSVLLPTVFPSGFSLDAYISFFTDEYYQEILIRTIRIALTTAIICILLGVPTAYFISRCPNKWKGILIAISIFPLLTNSVVRAFAWINILGKNGIINQILIKLGGESIFFMGEPQYFKAIYVISEIWQTTGWGTVIYLAALSGVSPDLYEAAVVDGATKWQRMIRIDLPCIMPTAIIQLILSTGKMFSIGYEKIFLMQNSLNRTVSEVISTYEYKQGILQSQFGYSAAIGLFNAVINLVILLTVNYLANKYSETSLW